MHVDVHATLMEALISSRFSSLSRTSASAVRYKKEGLQRSVEAVLLVHNHGHPHILLLQKANQTFTLPGGWLHPGEDGVPLCCPLT